MIKKNKLHLIIFPLLALIFCGWFFYRYVKEKGTIIEISFTDAKSIQAEKTRIVYRGVPVGIVKGIRISKKGDKAICEVSLESSAKQFAVEGTKFHLISPKVDFEGISGLETLISGSYIALTPGKSDKPKKKFKGHLSPLQEEREENTSSYKLETRHAESISSGDNVFFRGVVVGSVRSVELSPTAQSVIIKLDIKNKYTRLIRTNTLFWKKQGIKADLGLFNSDIKINSLDTILRGGIEIATPSEAGPLAKAGHTFSLKGEEPEEFNKWKPELKFK